MDAFEESTETNLPWATSIKQTFESNGMLETFLAAGTETEESEIPHILLFQRLKDQFHQDALASINEEGSKLKMYGSLKTETGTEKYLTDITNVKHRVDLTRLRLSSHSLNIETGRLDPLLENYLGLFGYGAVSLHVRLSQLYLQQQLRMQTIQKFQVWTLLELEY